jgi:hypothetical protein
VGKLAARTGFGLSTIARKFPISKVSGVPPEADQVSGTKNKKTET